MHLLHICNASKAIRIQNSRGVAACVQMAPWHTPSTNWFQSLVCWKYNKTDPISLRTPFLVHASGKAQISWKSTKNMYFLKKFSSPGFVNNVQKFSRALGAQIFVYTHRIKFADLLEKIVDKFNTSSTSKYC